MTHLENKKPRILTFDIETSVQLTYSWGASWKTRISAQQVITPKYFLGFSYKWLDEEETHQVFIHQGKKANLKKHNDTAVIKKLWELLNEADAVITYNGDSFDIKYFNTMCVKHNLPPTTPFKSIDLIKTARGRFRFETNKLDDVNKFLGFDGKHSMCYQDWIDCYNNDLVALQKMADYCDRDVEALEQAYLKLLPWIKGHPNMSILKGETCCTKCGGTNLRKGGWTVRYANGKQYRRVLCQECHTHCVDKNEFKGGREQKALINGW